MNGVTHANENRIVGLDKMARPIEQMPVFLLAQSLAQVRLVERLGYEHVGERFVVVGTINATALGGRCGTQLARWLAHDHVAGLKDCD